MKLENYNKAHISKHVFLFPWQLQLFPQSPDNFYNSNNTKESHFINSKHYNTAAFSERRCTTPQSIRNDTIYHNIRNPVSFSIPSMLQQFSIRITNTIKIPFLFYPFNSISNWQRIPNKTTIEQRNSCTVL